jgi:hypothetical protein
MLSKGSIPIPYIIAIIFGIIVIAVLAYWFFTTTGGVGTATQEAECEAALFEFCMNWIRAGEDNKPFDHKVVEDCGPLDIGVPIYSQCVGAYT